MPELTVSPRPSVVPAAIVLAFGAILAGCEREESPLAPSPDAITPSTPTIAPPPPPVLDRASLLQAMEDAASAYAAGLEWSGSALVGRRFILRQAFGCTGPTAPRAEATSGNGLAAWSWGDRQQTQRLTLTPGDWTGSPLIAGGSDTWEAAEGFWLARPWLRDEGCPGAQVDPLASGRDVASPQTVGLAAVFEEDGPRTGRRNGRAYDFTVRGVDGQPPAAPARGYRLVLEGRMSAFANGSAIRCRAQSQEQRPVCIGAVELDRVAFEDADGGVLSEWRGG